MAAKKTLMGFRVSEAFRKRIEAESIGRDLSIQDLITSALEYYFSTPRDWDHMAGVFVRHRDVPEEEIQEQEAWIKLWVAFVNEMPRQKILLHAEAMKLDLRHYKSSRRKTPKASKGGIS